MAEQAAKKKKGRISIRTDLCKECGFCIASCNKEQIVLATKLNAKGYRPAVFVDGGTCNACALCALVCPEAAIEVESE